MKESATPSSRIRLYTILFAAFGILLLAATRAASQPLSIEAEVDIDATHVMTDENASKGEFLEFMGDEPVTIDKEFSIDSFGFGYSTSEIEVDPGDKVTINLTSSSGKHDLVIDEISGATTSIISSGQTDSITFTVPEDAAGQTFKFYCSVGNHRELGMEENFIVSMPQLDN